MKIEIVVLAAIFGTIQAQEQNVGFEFFVTLATLEDPVRYESPYIVKCFETVEEEYQETVIYFLELVKPTVVDLIKKYDPYKTVTRALGNLKVMVLQWVLCHLKLSFLLKDTKGDKFRQTAAHIWECRKDINIHYDKYNIKMKGIRSYNREMHDYVRYRVNDIMNEAKRNCKILARDVKGCLREKSCMPYDDKRNWIREYLNNQTKIQ